MKIHKIYIKNYSSAVAADTEAARPAPPHLSGACLKTIPITD